MRDLFDLPDLAAMDDGIANGTYEPAPGEAQPLALFTAPRVDYSLHRLRHYTGTAPEHFQNFVLFTNYQFYIDEFVRLGHAADGRAPDGVHSAFVEPGNVVTRAPAGSARAPRRRACRRCRPTTWCGPTAAGITMVNIGVGPANAKTITDHIAVLRPHAWLMLGHCAGLRNTQQLGDYVLAHGYVREDHVLDEDLPLWVPIPALAEVQVALEQAVADVTQLDGYELKKHHAHRHRGQHRQPQLGTAAQSGTVAGAPLQPEPRDRARHGKRHHRRQRLSLPRALRHLAVRVSDKPLHGEIKLPGMADTFYRERVDQHLRIGMRAIELLREQQPGQSAQPQAAQLCRGGVPVAYGGPTPTPVGQARAGGPEPKARLALTSINKQARNRPALPRLHTPPTRGECCCAQWEFLPSTCARQSHATEIGTPPRPPEGPGAMARHPELPKPPPGRLRQRAGPGGDRSAARSADAVVGCRGTSRRGRHRPDGLVAPIRRPGPGRPGHDRRWTPTPA